MLTIPIQNIPNQNFKVIINGLNCNITLFNKDRIYGFSTDDNPLIFALYFNLSVNGNIITTNTICENISPLIKQKYKEFPGNFIFIDLNGNSSPFYSGLGTRFKLVYSQNF